MKKSLFKERQFSWVITAGRMRAFSLGLPAIFAGLPGDWSADGCADVTTRQTTGRLDATRGFFVSAG